MKLSVPAAAVALASLGAAQLDPLPPGNPPQCDPIAETFPSCIAPLIAQCGLDTGCARTDYMCKCEASTKAAISDCVFFGVFEDVSICGGEAPSTDALLAAIGVSNRVCACAEEFGSIPTTTDPAPQPTISLPPGTPEECDPLATLFPECIFPHIQFCGTDSGCAATDYTCKCQQEKKDAIQTCTINRLVADLAGSIAACGGEDGFNEAMAAAIANSEAICECAEEHASPTTPLPTSTPTSIPPLPTPNPEWCESLDEYTCGKEAVEDARISVGCAPNDYKCFCENLAFPPILFPRWNALCAGTPGYAVGDFSRDYSKLCNCATNPKPSSTSTTTTAVTTAEPTCTPAPLPPVCVEEGEDVPTCAKDCISPVIPKFGCQDINDYRCLCANEQSITGEVAACVVRGCGIDQAQNVLASVEALCHCVAEAPPAPEATGCSDSTTSVTTTSPTSIPPLPTPNPEWCESLDEYRCGNEVVKQARIAAGYAPNDYASFCVDPKFPDFLLPRWFTECNGKVEGYTGGDFSRDHSKLCDCASSPKPSSTSTTTTAITSAEPSCTPPPAPPICVEEGEDVLQCAKDCISPVITQFGCRDITDFRCLCANEQAITGEVAACVVRGCGFGQVQAVLDSVEALCHCVAEAPPAPEETGCSVSTTSVTTTSPTSIPPLPTPNPEWCESLDEYTCGKEAVEDARISVGCAPNDYKCFCDNLAFPPILFPRWNALCAGTPGYAVGDFSRDYSKLCNCATNPKPSSTSTTTTAVTTAEPTCTPAPLPPVCVEEGEDVPTCAKDCISPVIPKFGCQDINDYRCLCANQQSITGEVAACVVRGCGIDQAENVLASVEDLCHCVAEAPPAPVDTGCSVTPPTTSPTTSPTTGVTPIPTGGGNPPECDALPSQFPACAFPVIQECGLSSGCDATDYICKCVTSTRNAISSCVLGKIEAACGDEAGAAIGVALRVSGEICACAEANKPDTTSKGTTTSPTDVPPTSTPTTTDGQPSCTPKPVVPPCQEEGEAVPACAKSCIAPVAPKYGCDGIDDFACLCDNITAIQGEVALCAATECGKVGVDLGAVISSVTALCSCQASAPPPPEDTDCTVVPPPTSKPTTTPPPPTSSKSSITKTTTKISTITSCPPEATKCKPGDVTVTTFTTVCPDDETSAPPAPTSTCIPSEPSGPVCEEETSEVPTCALECIAPVAPDFGCSGVDDFDCLCSNIDAIRTSILNCVLEGCGQDVAIGVVLPAVTSACECIAAAPPPTEGNDCPTDGGPKPTDGGPKPSDGGPKPTDGGPKPTDGGPKPTDTTLSTKPGPAPPAPTECVPSGPVCEDEAADVPECALDCIAPVAPDFGCSGVDDFECLCANIEEIRTSILNCVLEGCGSDVAVGTVLPAVTELCTCVASAPPPSDGTDCPPGGGDGPGNGGSDGPGNGGGDGPGGDDDEEPPKGGPGGGDDDEPTPTGGDDDVKPPVFTGAAGALNPVMASVMAVIASVGMLAFRL